MSITDSLLSPGGILSSFRPISLEEMDSVRLMNRTDTKFVFSVSKLDSLMEEICAGYRILEINGNRAIHYETYYFDTKEYDLYRDHHNGKASRFKVRYRKYTDSNLNFFEIKIKNNKGKTVKERIKRKGINTVIEGKSESLLTRYTPFLPGDLVPVIEVFFTRFTLVNENMTERATIDVDLRFKNHSRMITYEGIVIAEVKMDKTKHSGFIQLMHHHGIDEFAISKYCLGMSSLIPGIKMNNFKPKLLQIQKINRHVC